MVVAGLVADDAELRAQKPKKAPKRAVTVVSGLPVPGEGSYGPPLSLPGNLGSRPPPSSSSLENLRH